MGDLLPLYQHIRILSQDSKSKTITILGTIKGEHAIISAEKSAFDENSVNQVTMPDAYESDVSNDIYHKFFVSYVSDARTCPAAKYSMIYPATQVHIDKYTQQKRRMVTEDPETYEKIVLPYIMTMVAGRLQWVYNILDHRAESDRIAFEDPDPQDGFILLPDLKWDGITISALYLVCIVHRRDVKSLRDLSGEHLSYLRHLKDSCISAVRHRYAIDPDQLRLYIHYQPSYYHFHIHVQTCDYEAGAGQAIGKAFLLDDVIELLSRDGKIFQERTLHYSLGEESDLFKLLARESESSA